jgi:hypothetical protein
VSSWNSFDPMTPTTWPRVAGVYAIYFDAELVYIGQSCDVASRMARHAIKFGYARNIRTPWAVLPDSVSVTAKVKPSKVVGDWAMWEIRLIRRLQPAFNRAHLRPRLVA